MRTLCSDLFRRTALAAVALVACATAGCANHDNDSAAGNKPTESVHSDPTLFAKLPPRLQQSKMLAVGTEAMYPPYEYLEPDGTTIVGIDPDLLQAITQRIGISFTQTNTAFDGLLPSLAAGRFDVVSAAVSDTPARRANYEFVDYFRAGQGILVKKGNPEKISTVEDMCGKAVSVLTSSAQEALLNQFNTAECASDPIVIASLPTDQDALLQVQSGRSAAAFTQSPVAAYNAKTVGGGSQFERANSEQIAPNFLGFVFDKKNVQLRDTFQAAIQSLIDDGTYKKILDSHDVGDGAVATATLNGGAS